MKFEMMNAILKNLRHYNVKNEFPILNMEQTK